MAIDGNVVATAIVEIVPDTTKFKQALGNQLSAASSSVAKNVNKNVKINPMVDDIKLRQNAMRIQNQYEKLAGDLRNVFAGIGVVGLGLGKSAIGGFLKSDTVDAKVLRSQLGDLSTAWAKVGGKLAQANLGGKTIGQWVEKLARALDKLSVEKIERFAKIAAGFAVASGFIQALKVANNIMDTFEKIGILKDKRSLIGAVPLSSNSSVIASNLGGGIVAGRISGGISGGIAKSGLKEIQNGLNEWFKKESAEVYNVNPSSKKQKALREAFDNLSKNAGKKISETPINTLPIKAGIGSLIGTFAKALGVGGLVFAAGMPIAEELGKYLGKGEEAPNMRGPSRLEWGKEVEGDLLFKSVKEFEDFLNKERNDRIKKAFTKSTSAMASASEFVKEQEAPGNFLPNTKGDSKVIFAQAGERIKELNAAVADLAKQWKSKQDNPEFKAESERLKKSLDEVWRVRSSAFSEIVKSTEEEKAAIKEKNEKNKEISKATVENEKEKSKLLSEFGRDQNKLREDALKSLANDKKDYKKSLRDLTFGKGEFGKTTDVQSFLQSSIKSFGSMEEDKRKLNEEARAKEEETKKDYAEAIRETGIEFSESIKKLEEDMARNRKEIEDSYTKKLEENSSALNTLKEVIASLNMNVAPAY